MAEESILAFDDSDDSIPKQFEPPVSQENLLALDHDHRAKPGHFHSFEQCKVGRLRL